MTDHADTIRRPLAPGASQRIDEWSDEVVLEVAAAVCRERAKEAPRLTRDAATARRESGQLNQLAARLDRLESLVAERQQAIDDLDRTTTAANRIEQQLVEAAAVVVDLRGQLRQAIDALREIAKEDQPFMDELQGIARAALLSLGEQQ